MPDPRERLDDIEEAIRSGIQGIITGLWTALPGIVQSFDPAKMTCVIQPSILGQQRNTDGSTKSIKMPLLLDCPVCFQGGGRYTGTFPIAAGDEALVVFSSRCIDGWWQSGGLQPQAELRLHDLSDGFAIVGVRSLPRALDGISTTAARIVSDDYTGVAGTGELFEVGPGKIKLVADEIVFAGRNKVNIGANGCGVQYVPTGVNTWTDGTTGTHQVPSPPEIPE